MEEATTSAGRLLEALRAARPRADIVAEITKASVRARLFGVPAERPRLGRYEVLAHIGGGAMGTVFRAHDPKLGRDIALKLVQTCGPELRSYVQREARAMARISHPNVVAVHDTDVLDDAVVIAMELVAGPTLRERLRRGKPRWRETLRLMIGACRGLAAAHASGIVHGDFKPENVLLGDDGRARVADFGLARAATEPTDASAGGGTPAYMAPERLRELDRPATDRSDQYSYCLTLAEALCGQRPGPDERASTEHLAAMLRTSPMPRRLRRAVLRGMHPDEARRFASLDELLEELVASAGRGRRRTVVALLAAAATAGAAAALASAPSEPAAMCTEGAALFERAWESGAAAGSREDAIRTNFSASELPHADDIADDLMRAIAAYGARWERSYQDACEATHVRGDQSSALLDARMRCLRTRLAAAEALGDAMSTASDQAITGAGEAIAGLPLVRDCDDLEALMARDDEPVLPLARERLAALGEELAAAEVRFYGSKDAAEMEVATRVRAEAAALGGLTLEAEALSLSARVVELERPHEAVAAWERVLAASARAGVDRLIAEASASMLRHTAHHEGSLDRAAGIEPFAEAAAIRAGELEAMAAFLDAALFVRLVGGELADAHAYLDRADALDRDAKRRGSDGRMREDRARVRLLSTVSQVRQDLGEYDAAGAALDEIAEILQNHQPPSHSDQIAARMLRARLHGAQGAYRQAVDDYAEGIALSEMLHGSDYARLIPVRGNYAQFLRLFGDLDEAEKQDRRAYELARELYGDQHALTATPLLGLGRTALLRGELDTAREMITRAVHDLSESIGADHLYVAHALHALGEVELGAGELREARRVYERALAIAEHAQHDGVAVAVAHRGLGELAIAEERWGQALSHCRRALAREKELFGENEAGLADSLTCVGEAELGAGRTKRAIATLERALALRSDAYAHIERGRTAFSLARALQATDPARAAELAAQAERAFAAAGPVETLYRATSPPGTK